MTIQEQKNQQTLTVLLTGELDIKTSPELSEFLQPRLSGAEGLVVDMQGIDYMSSAGIRVLLATNKEMVEKNKTMKIIGCNDIVWEAFEITGLDEVMDISRQE